MGFVILVHYFASLLTNKLAEKCQPGISDGITLGHACCGVFCCTEYLQSNHHHFCAQHFHKHKECAVVDCDRPVSDGKACDNPNHQKMQTLCIAKGGSAFSLTEWLQCQCVSHPNDSMGAYSAAAVANLEIEENVEWFEEVNGEMKLFQLISPGCVGIHDDGIPGDMNNLLEDVSIITPCDAKNDLGNKKVKAQFGRCCTHNEQKMLRSCGTFVGRATMHGTEAVSNVLLSC
jgi:hypothetical protein